MPRSSYEFSYLFLCWYGINKYTIPKDKTDNINKRLELEDELKTFSKGTNSQYI